MRSSGQRRRVQVQEVVAQAHARSLLAEAHGHPTLELADAARFILGRRSGLRLERRLGFANPLQRTRLAEQLRRQLVAGPLHSVTSKLLGSSRIGVGEL
jgi:hypothetical protein